MLNYANVFLLNLVAASAVTIATADTTGWRMHNSFLLHLFALSLCLPASALSV